MNRSGENLGVDLPILSLGRVAQDFDIGTIEIKLIIVVC